MYHSSWTTRVLRRSYINTLDKASTILVVSGRPAAVRSYFIARQCEGVVLLVLVAELSLGSVFHPMPSRLGSTVYVAQLGPPPRLTESARRILNCLATASVRGRREMDATYVVYRI